MIEGDPKGKARVPACLAWFALLLTGCGASGDEAPGDLVLVILDTARADHFSSYGYPRATTPNFDRLAAEGERYDEAYAQAPWTLPAVATILTGLPPHLHGAGRGKQGMFGIRREVRTLAERLQQAGYSTGAFINVIWCDPDLSDLGRGFDVYDFRSTNESNRGQRDAGRTTDAALAWLRGLRDEPSFLVVHYFDPHLTYDPPAPFDTMFESEDGPRVREGFGSAAEVFQVRDGSIRLDPARRKSLVARYDGELAYTDQQFGRLREGLEQLGRWDDATVVVVADHGEEFWEHGGFEHGHSHYREMLRIPLILRTAAGPAGVVRRGRARQIDIAPTLLEAAGLPRPADLPGRRLGRQEGARYAVAEGSLWAGDLVSIRSDLGTLILNRTTNDTRFFGPQDPLEQSPTTAAQPAQDELLRLLQALPPPRSRDAAPQSLTDEQLDQLRALGYIQ